MNPMCSRARIRRLFRIGVFTLVLVAGPFADSLVAADDVVLRGGHIFDTERGTFVSNPGIRVRAGKFLAMGSDGAAPARVVDLASDDYVLPGLFDLHAHYNVNLFGRKRRDETTVNPVLFLANGVTSTFPAGEFDPEGMMEASRRIARGEQIGPRLFNSGPYFGSARRGWSHSMSTEDLIAEVDLWAERGVAGFKVKGIRENHLQVLVDRAHLHGLTVTGHLGSGYRGSVNPRDAIRLGIDRVEHFLGGDALPETRSAYASLETLDPDMPEIREVIDLYVNNGVVFDATITAYGYFGDREVGYDHWTDESRFFTPYVRKYLKKNPPRRRIDQFARIHDVKRKTIRAFYEAGGTITLGTDHVSSGEYLAGFSSHRELHAFVLAGIPPGEALKIATLHGARAVGMGDRLGSIEPGKLADLFVVRGNPLEEIRNTRNVRLVMKAGRLHDPVELLRSVEGKMGPRNEAEARSW